MRGRNLVRPEDGRLLLVRILVCPVLLVITLSVGCSGLLEDPYERANDSLAEATEAIDEHNRLFEEARGTYEEVKESVEAGEDASEETERISQARETMQEARDSLKDARGPLLEVQDLDVEDEIKEYAALLSEAVDAQLAGEGSELGFYEILERDPTLSENREEAQDILAKAEDGYEEARDAYSRAQELAEANPELLKEGSR